VAAVTIGMSDPDDSVAGGGADQLSKAGIAVAWASDPGPFELQNEGWLTRITTGRPFVRVKVALTLDGRAALAARRRSRISGAGGRRITMRLRSEATAVAVGAATAAIDDPQLTVRDTAEQPAERNPLRLILSRTSVPNPRLSVFTDGNGPSVVVTSDAVSPQAVASLEACGVRVLRYAYRDGLTAALKAIAAEGINDVLVETGPSLFSALWRERLIDELVLVTAGGMSGNAAPPLFLGQADADGADLAPVMCPVETGVAEGDAVTVWRRMQ
jgi:diaminohydroxyphosphoribosylaminopyrimidine deaminase/5-amino-6-(5-phosphoribosylamino)uracil reductase